LVGNALKELSEEDRSKVVLGTKVNPANGVIVGGVEKNVTDSLERL